MKLIVDVNVNGGFTKLVFNFIAGSIKFFLGEYNFIPINLVPLHSPWSVIAANFCSVRYWWFVVKLPSVSCKSATGWACYIFVLVQLIAKFVLRVSTDVLFWSANIVHLVRRRGGFPKFPRDSYSGHLLGIVGQWTILSIEHGRSFSDNRIPWDCLASNDHTSLNTSISQFLNPPRDGDSMKVNS
ncbi:hypothetical protein NE237_023585 [Protea cynaroides]|uniref:Uncharacterized protein n=1 Tax=Protea cynaroides TaxID=273540 RepID=A0A9Q0K5A7_9MAGN|nr:hypothetical protein NE237_023585 [Protea cynaroides]